jgi:phage shock protein A
MLTPQGVTGMDAIQQQLTDHDRRIQRLEDSVGDIKQTTDRTQNNISEMTSRIDQLYKAVIGVGVVIVGSLIGVIATVLLH